MGSYANRSNGSFLGLKSRDTKPPCWDAKKASDKAKTKCVVFFCLASVGIMEVFYPVTEDLQRAYF